MWKRHGAWCKMSWPHRRRVHLSPAGCHSTHPPNCKGASVLKQGCSCSQLDLSVQPAVEEMFGLFLLTFSFFQVTLCKLLLWLSCVLIRPLWCLLWMEGTTCKIHLFALTHKCIFVLVSMQGILFVSGIASAGLTKPQVFSFVGRKLWYDKQILDEKVEGWWQVSQGSMPTTGNCYLLFTCEQLHLLKVGQSFYFSCWLFL